MGKKQSIFANPILWGVIILVVGVGGYFYFQNIQSSSETETANNNSNSDLQQPTVSPTTSIGNSPTTSPTGVTPSLTPSTSTTPIPSITPTDREDDEESREINENTTSDRMSLPPEERFQYDVKVGLNILNKAQCVVDFKKSVENYSFEYGMLPNGDIEFHLYEKVNKEEGPTFGKYQFDPETNAMINQETKSENICE